MITQNKRLIIILVTATLLLFVPFTAMQFTAEVKWTLADFITAAVLLYGTGISCEFVLRKVKAKKIRITMCVLLLVILLLIWIQLAVGIF